VQAGFEADAEPPPDPARDPDILAAIHKLEAMLDTTIDPAALVADLEAGINWDMLRPKGARSLVNPIVEVPIQEAVRAAVDPDVQLAVGMAMYPDVPSVLATAFEVILALGHISVAVPASFLEQVSSGGHPTGWGLDLELMATCSFFRDVCALDLPEWDAFAELETLHRSCGLRVLRHDLAMVSDRPAHLHRDADGRLHAVGGPAIAWRDGWALWFWHGQRIPPSHHWAINAPATITRAAIEGEPNADLRRVMREASQEARRDGPSS